MKRQPILETTRLVLRPLMAKDALAVRDLANNEQIAELSIWPLYPCGRKLARLWIAGANERWATGSGAEFGIELTSGGEMFGLVGLTDLDARHASAELGFLLHPRYWGNGYATEAAAVVVAYGFGHLKLNRIYADHLVRNAASGRVLAKLGMKPEGLLRQAAKKSQGFEDVVLMALLREEWARQSEE